MNLKELKKIFREELQKIYSKEESQTILTYILTDALGIPKLSIISQSHLDLDEIQSEKILTVLFELKKGVPVQYLIGKAHFYGMMLNVTPDVLIPRPETEELVDWVIKDNKGAKLKILDVGTGSGCIALALKMNLPESGVTAIDISEKAMEVAKQNANDLKLEVQFKKVNAIYIKEEMKNESFDIIVSNPPYIPSSDKISVQQNVYMYEPHLALFVPDETPLIFYESIASFAKKSNSATLYFEIYEDSGDDLVKLLKKMSMKEIVIKKDLNGKNRMLRCRIFT